MQNSTYSHDVQNNCHCNYLLNIERMLIFKRFQVLWNASRQNPVFLSYTHM